MAKTYDTQIAEEIRNQLQASEYWLDKTKGNRNTISPLVCPVCGYPKAWVYEDKPFAIICNRLNNCSARTPTIQLFNIARDIEKKFAPTTKDPRQPAKVYLKLRGLNKSLKNLSYEYFSKTREGCGGAVMFPVGVDRSGKKIYNGRLFNPPPGEGKTHNMGSTSGMYWKHPGMEYDSEKPVYVTEGIIDALSLIEMGVQAIAVLSSGADPATLDLRRFNHLVTAFDNDHAGIRATQKWQKWFVESYQDKGVADAA